MRRGFHWLNDRMVLMTEHKKINPKTSAKAILQVSNNNLDTLISALAIQWPLAAGLLKLAQVSFGFYLIYKQEEINEFSKYIQDNNSVFTPDLMNSKEFQDGFTVALEDYFKLRSKSKREIARTIFFGFAQDKDKTEFPIERLNGTLKIISSEGLRTLGFIHTEIVPYMNNDINDEFERNDGHLTLDEKARGEHIELIRRTKSLSEYMYKWIHEHYEFNNPTVRKEFHLPDTIGQEELFKLQKLEQVKNDEISESVNELEQLGLIHSYNVGIGTWSGGGTAYDLTKYGSRFIQFLS